jgi:hypothetical protein
MILTIVLINAKNRSVFPFHNISSNNIEKKIFEDREIATRSDHLFTLTGREVIWRDIFNKTKNKWYIGNGPQADRYIVGQSASNLLFYAFSSGGLISFLIFIYIYTYIAKRLILAILRKKFELIKKDPVLFSSTLCLIYIFIRSMFESSFGVFGIDLIIFLTSFVIFDKHLES